MDKWNSLVSHLNTYFDWLERSVNFTKFTGTSTSYNVKWMTKGQFMQTQGKNLKFVSKCKIRFKTFWSTKSTFRVVWPLFTSSLNYVQLHTICFVLWWVNQIRFKTFWNNLIIKSIWIRFKTFWTTKSMYFETNFNVWCLSTCVRINWPY